MNNKSKLPKFNWKYIIGEVSLIFIGISLAIWFNNWNENQKLKRVEVQILQEIKNGLQADLKDLQINMNGHKEGIRATQHISGFYTGGPVNRDSLIKSIYAVRSNFSSLRNTAPYEFLKSQGISIINDDSLRLAITGLYEYNYKNLEQIELIYGPMQFYQNHTDLIWENLKPLLTFSEGRIVPIKRNGKEQIDIQFLYTLGEIRSLRSIAVREYTKTIKQLKTIIEAIDNYLN